MRTNTDLDIQHSGDLTGDEVKMSFDENAVAHLMSVLTDLYSDPVMAVIREYSTNALDSHIAAGLKAPIEVILPTDIAPVFRVRDHGVGLSVEDVHNVYSKYGYSTKRGNDDEAGMLGLGCKSGLTYTAQFTLKAVKDGVQTTAAVLRGEDGAGSIRIIDTVATAAPNGVEVTIPVTNVRVFRERAETFFRFWEPGTVLVNGKAPEPWNGLALDDSVLLTSETDSDYIVMGPVAYPVGWSEAVSPVNGQYIVARVPMGAVNFTPSREALQYTNRTRETLATLRAWVEDNLTRRVQEEVDACTTHGEAMRLVVERKAVLQKLKYRPTFLGAEVPAQFKVKDPASPLTSDSKAFFYDSTVSGRRYSRSPLREVNYVDAEQVVKGDVAIVVNHTNSTVSGTNREKLRVHAEESGLDINKWVLVEDVFGAPWTDGLPVIDWDEVKAIRLTRAYGGSRRRTSGTYDIVKTESGATETVTEVDAERIVFVSPTESVARSTYYRNRRESDYTKILAVYNDDDTAVITLAANRHDKFLRENDDAEHVRDAIATDIKAFVRKLTPAQAYALSNGSTVLSGLPAGSIDDPEVVAVVKELDTVPRVERQALYDRWNKLKALMHACYPYQDMIPDLPVSALSARIESIEASYPLLTVLESGASDDNIVTYINALYAQ